jgi:hypothetical protein
MGWLGFWIFMAVYCICDTWLYSRGHETFFWGYKTPEEKQLQQNIINNTKGECR